MAWNVYGGASLNINTDMANTNTPTPKTRAELETALRLSAADTSALLSEDRVRTAYRKYRRRIPPSLSLSLSLSTSAPTSSSGPALPDWKDVDAFLYQLRLSPEVRDLEKGMRLTRGAALQLRLAALCRRGVEGDEADDMPLLLPHVGLFVLRFCAFLDLERGGRFDVGGCGGGGERDGGGGDAEREFRRCRRGVLVLAYMVACDEEFGMDS